MLDEFSRKWEGWQRRRGASRLLRVPVLISIISHHWELKPF